MDIEKEIAAISEFNNFVAVNIRHLNDQLAELRNRQEAIIKAINDNELSMKRYVDVQIVTTDKILKQILDTIERHEEILSQGKVEQDD